MSAQEQRQNKGNSTLIIAFAAVVVILLVVIIVLLVNNSKSANVSTEETQKRPTVVNEENAEDVAEQLFSQDETEKVEAGTYDVVMNSTWNFENGDVASKNAYVENAKENTNDVYFDVVISDTQELIYESPVIPIGSHIDEIKLDKSLEAGTYDCELTYHLIDENQNTLSTLTMVITVNIEN